MTHAATIPDRIRARGVSLIEGVLYLVLALAIIVGGIVFFQQASFSRQVNAMAGMMTSVSGQLVHGLKSNSETAVDPAFEAADMSQYAIRAGMVPSELVAVTSEGSGGDVGLISFDVSGDLPVPMPLSGVTGDFGIVKAQSIPETFDMDRAYEDCLMIKDGRMAFPVHVPVSGSCEDPATLLQLGEDAQAACTADTGRTCSNPYDPTDMEVTSPLPDVGQPPPPPLPPREPFRFDEARQACEDAKAFGEELVFGLDVTVSGSCDDDATLLQLAQDIREACSEERGYDCGPIFGHMPAGAGGEGIMIRSFWGGVVSFAEASVLVEGQRTPVLAARMNDLPTGACMRLGHKNAGGDTQVGVNVFGIAVEDNGMTNDDWAWTQGEVLHFTGPGEETDFEDLSTACDRDNPDLVVYYEVNGVPGSGPGNSDLPLHIDYAATGTGSGSGDEVLPRCRDLHHSDPQPCVGPPGMILE